MEERDPRMTFLKVEPKLQNLRSTPAFTDILQSSGLLKLATVTLSTRRQ